MDKATPAKGFTGMAGLFLVLAVVCGFVGYTSAGENAAKILAKSFVYGYGFWFILSVGCLGMLMLHHTIRGKWSRPIMRVWEAGASPVNFGILAVGAGLLFVLREKIYKWMDPAYVTGDKILEQKTQGFLTQPLFLAVTIVAFLFYFVMSSNLIKWQKKEDEDGEKKWADKRASFAAPGLVFFFLINTFLFTMWFMSLDAHWFSTIYGAWLIVGGALGALGLAGMAVVPHSKKEPYKGVITPSFTKDLGNMTLAFTLLWTYFSFSQYLITWSGNLPEFTIYFLDRQKPSYLAVAYTLMVGQFLVPFFALLSPSLKRNPRLLATIGGWVFTMRFFDIYYILVPSLKMGTENPFLPMAMVFGVGAAWLFGFSYTLGSSALMPRAQSESHAHEGELAHV